MSATTPAAQRPERRRPPLVPPPARRLSLAGLGLEGPVSPALAGLEGLTLLDLSSNALTGSVPPLSLNKLTSLSLDTNKLSGGLPTLGGTPNLQNATLHSNQLTGDGGGGCSGQARGGGAGCGRRVREGCCGGQLAPGPGGAWSWRGRVVRRASWRRRAAASPTCTRPRRRAAGSIPSGWNSLGADASLTLLPNNLCGAVPKQPFPQLWLVTGGSRYPLVNSLGSCFKPDCNNAVQSERRAAAATGDPCVARWAG